MGKPFEVNCVDSTGMGHSQPYVLLIVAVLGYLMVTTIMRVLAAHYHRHRAVHDLVRMAKQARVDYYRDLAIRRGMISGTDDPNLNVIIEDDGGNSLSSDATIPEEASPKEAAASETPPPETAGKIDPQSAEKQAKPQQNKPLEQAPDLAVTQPDKQAA